MKINNPVSKNKNSDEKDIDIFCQAGSANDCTGLIPSAIEDNAQFESYEELYNFIIPHSTLEDIQKDK